MIHLNSYTIKREINTYQYSEQNDRKLHVLELPIPLNEQ